MPGSSQTNADKDLLIAIIIVILVVWLIRNSKPTPFRVSRLSSGPDAGKYLGFSQNGSKVTVNFKGGTPQTIDVGNKRVERMDPAPVLCKDPVYDQPGLGFSITTTDGDKIDICIPAPNIIKNVTAVGSPAGRGTVLKFDTVPRPNGIADITIRSGHTIMFTDILTREQFLNLAKAYFDRTPNIGFASTDRTTGSNQVVRYSELLTRIGTPVAGKNELFVVIGAADESDTNAPPGPSVIFYSKTAINTGVTDIFLAKDTANSIDMVFLKDGVPFSLTIPKNRGIHCIVHRNLDGSIRQEVPAGCSSTSGTYVSPLLTFNNGGEFIPPHKYNSLVAATNLTI